MFIVELGRSVNRPSSPRYCAQGLSCFWPHHFLSLPCSWRRSLMCVDYDLISSCCYVSYVFAYAFLYHSWYSCLRLKPTPYSAHSFAHLRDTLRLGLRFSQSLYSLVAVVVSIPFALLVFLLRYPLSHVFHQYPIPYDPKDCPGSPVCTIVNPTFIRTSLHTFLPQHLHFYTPNSDT